MKRPMIAVLAVCAVSLGEPALAQTPAIAPVARAVDAPKPVDPVALQSATRIAAALLPDGTYRKMMSGTLDKMMSGMVDRMGDLPMREIMIAAGMNEQDVPKVQPGAMKDVMQILDPAFNQRMDLGMKAMMGKMVDLMSKYEPAVRDGVAEAYAKRFSQNQLTELERFFATPTGKEYAAQSMLIYTDPAVMNRMTAMMPDMMNQLPSMIGAMTEATKDLPRQRTYKDLTPAERARVAQILGIDPKKMK